ncbi:MAG: hypothetical protein HY727_21700 [Candidatus Rokubacteria bacterium]|nr:hypothetical protein [Candidatus Rokubacteria bacterium]
MKARFSRLVYCLISACVFSTSVMLLSATAEAQASKDSRDVLKVLVSGTVAVEGEPYVLAARGTVNQTTGEYSLQFAPPPLASAQGICPLEKVLATWFPKVALKFLVSEKGEKKGADLYTASGRRLIVQLRGVPKRDAVSGLNRLSATIQIQASSPEAASIVVDGVINTITAPCRNLEDAGGMYGHSVIRLGIKPVVASTRRFTGGSYIGIGAVDLDVPDGNPEGLGGADFWNLEGTFRAPISPVASPKAVASVDVGHMARRADAVTGTVMNFAGTTLPMRAVLTIDGVATADGEIHQHLAVSDARGGGPFLVHFDIPVKKGDTPAQVAARIVERLNQSKAAFAGGGNFLATQGGTGLGISKADATSARVALCVSRDGTSCVGPDDQIAAQAFRVIMTQAFGDAGFHSFRNSGITQTFGVLGQPPLVGWLTPFKVVFFTDNPATNLRAAGGEITIQANTCSTTNGRDCDPSTIKRVPPFTIKTSSGETAEQIAQNVTRALVRLGIKCVQRVGTIVYMDAGVEMPSTLTVRSGDPGIGLMSAAADLPTLNEPH